MVIVSKGDKLPSSKIHPQREKKMSIDPVERKNIESAINEITKGNPQKWPAKSVAITAMGISQSCARYCEFVAKEMGCKA
jgi:hypothetical protein